MLVGWLAGLPGVTMCRSGESMSTPAMLSMVTGAPSSQLSHPILSGHVGHVLRSRGRSLPTMEGDTNIVFVRVTRLSLKNVSPRPLSCLTSKSNSNNKTTYPIPSCFILCYSFKASFTMEQWHQDSHPRNIRQPRHCPPWLHLGNEPHSTQVSQRQLQGRLTLCPMPGDTRQ